MLRVFCDFDGTVAPADVGNSLFRTFAGKQAEAIVSDYLGGIISAPECLSRECRALGPVERSALESFVDTCSIDPSFIRFAAFCATEEIPLTILSDGLDFYIGRMLARAGLDVRFYANHAVWEQDARGRTYLIPEFPYKDEHGDECGNCKGNHLVTLSGDEDIVVYVGDGVSDRCPVCYADIVFAKGALIPICQGQNISYTEYRNFSDVQSQIIRIRSTKRLKRRREAVMARRDRFMME